MMWPGLGILEEVDDVCILGSDATCQAIISLYLPAPLAEYRHTQLKTSCLYRFRPLCVSRSSDL